MIKSKKILAFATQGSGGDDELRLQSLLSKSNSEFFEFNNKSKVNSFIKLITLIFQKEYDLFIMEGTGIAGGLALIIGSFLLGTKYIVSSGDAVAPFLTSKFPIGKPIFFLYEKCLMAFSSGYIGWTPYLCGRAMTYGSPKTITAAGWNPHKISKTVSYIRNDFGINPNDIVIGIVGSLNWNPNKKYCYGLELVQACHLTTNKNIKIIIVGDGSGKIELEKRSGELLDKKIFLPGRISREKLSDYYHAIDIGSLPQSGDQIGSFRYTTKISEYLGFKIPIVTGPIPLAYDFGADWIWKINSRFPWTNEYAESLAHFFNSITSKEVIIKKKNIQTDRIEFNKNDQIFRVSEFINDLII